MPSIKKPSVVLIVVPSGIYPILKVSYVQPEAVFAAVLLVGVIVELF